MAIALNIAGNRIMKEHVGICGLIPEDWDLTTMISKMQLIQF